VPKTSILPIHMMYDSNCAVQLNSVCSAANCTVDLKAIDECTAEKARGCAPVAFVIIGCPLETRLEKGIAQKRVIDGLLGAILLRRSEKRVQIDRSV
jgi:hypothetical protein